MRRRNCIAVPLAATIAYVLAACGGGSSTSSLSGSSGSSQRQGATTTGPPQPTFPQVLRSATSSRPTPYVPAVTLRGQTAVWIARSSAGVTLLSFDQQLLGLQLHSGTIDAGSSGWRFGPVIAAAERKKVVAAFAGAFKFSTGSGGFMSDGRVGAPLRNGLGSIVTYADGHTDIGAWHRGVPAAGSPVASVRQNLTLLLDHGAPASNLDCKLCWGATLGGVPDPARAALGITASGKLVWAGGEHVTISSLAHTLMNAAVQRAVELDINPEWVAAYLYKHHGLDGGVSPVLVVPGAPGVPGSFLTPYSRDFFTLVAR
jgi:hypothetical protein